MRNPLKREHVEQYLDQACRDGRLSYNMASWVLHHDEQLRKHYEYEVEYFRQESRELKEELRG